MDTDVPMLSFNSSVDEAKKLLLSSSSDNTTFALVDSKGLFLIIYLLIKKR